MLKYALALVLVFVGLKMAWLNDLFRGKFPVVVSLAIIDGIVALSIALSFLIPKRQALKPAAALTSTDESNGIAHASPAKDLTVSEI